MSAKTKHCHLNSELTLRDRSHSPLPIHSSILTLNPPNECRLTVQINPQIYQRIETEALFNLKPELRGSFSAENFQPESNIEIEATLQPDLLVHLSECTTSEDAVTLHSPLLIPLLNTPSE